MVKIDRILLVDDDNITNFLNVRLIKKLNLSTEIKIANNGHEALAYLKEARSKQMTSPSLIFLDINMPLMNGLEFIDTYKNTKTWNKKPVIIVLSSSDNKSDINVLKSSNVISDILLKPLTEEKVLAVVDKYFS
ncbi:MAG: response regulator [Opitutaceae bacterium]|nr:response regulator [Cytophagales bacterium]